MMKKMNIIGIIGSPRVNGNTSTLIKEALKAANNEGAKIQEIFLSKYNIQYCKGCMSCLSTGRCVISDDNFEELRKIILEADGLILGSPNYGGSISALLKTFFERYGLFEYATSSLGGKYAVGISTSSEKMGANKVAKQTIKYIKEGVFKRGFISGTLGVATNGEHVSHNKKAMEKAYGLGVNLAKDIKNKKRYTFQNSTQRLLNRLVIRPIFKKFILKNKDGRMEGVYENLRNRNLIDF
ncbi:MAG: flavodoxin family protein [Candidatus Lokiarchaeota archaeon]|nr:flavodoxin family protein [Candidatus Lokiarchaeota archaeon]